MRIAPMSGDKVRWPVRGLWSVATFMNTIGPRTTAVRWTGLLEKICKQLSLPARPMSFDDAKLLRRQIHYDLAFLRWINIEPDRVNDPISWTDDEREFFRSDTPQERPFDRLVERLNDLPISMVWQCDHLSDHAKPKDPSQAIMKLRWGGATTGRWAIRSLPRARELKAYLYGILGRALEAGMLDLLKVCRECENYMVVDDLKTRDCSAKCHTDYHNRETHAGNRKHRKELAILKAKKLAEAGKSSAVIQKETRLPRRAVEQILSGDLSPNSQLRPKTVPRPKRRTAGLDPTFVPIPLTREKLETIIAEEAHRDEVYMQGIRAARKPSKQKPARKSK